MSETSTSIDTTGATLSTQMPETRLTAIPGGKPNLDAVALEVASAAAAVNEPVRLRLTTMLFRPKSGKQYQHWLGVGWKMEFASFDEIVEFREALTAFITQWFEARRVPRG